MRAGNDGAISLMSQFFLLILFLFLIFMLCIVLYFAIQLEEERLATIERDNRILLEKMSYIMRTRGRIDNRNNYEYKR